MGTNKNFQDNQVLELFTRIQSWLSDEKKQLSFADVKKRVLNKAISNPKDTLKSKDLKNIMAYLSYYNDAKKEKGDNGTANLYDFSSLIKNLTEKQLNNLIYDLDNQKKPTSSLIPIKGISKVQQARLRDLKIYDIQSLLTRCKTVNERKKLADQLGVDVRMINSWMKQALLWRVEGMTTDLAYLLVMAGVRNVEDLSKVDKAKVIPILRGLMATQIDFEFEEAELDMVLKNAQEMVLFNPPIKVNALSSQLSDSISGITDSWEDELVRSVSERISNSLPQNAIYNIIEGEKLPSNKIVSNNSKVNVFDDKIIANLIKEESKKLIQNSTGRFKEFFKNEIYRYQKDNSDTMFNILSDSCDEEPTHLFRDDINKPLEILNGKNIKKGLDFLDDIQPSLPLPRKISGVVTIRKKDEQINISRPDDSVYFQGCRRLSGALVEIQGIVSPSDDLKEASSNPSCVTDGIGRFVIVLPERYSMKDTITLVVSVGSKKQTFIKTASEIIESVEQYNVLKQFYAIDALGDEIDYLDSLITPLSDQVEYLEDEISKLISDIEKLNASLKKSSKSEIDFIQAEIDEKEKERALKIVEKDQYRNKLIEYLQNRDILSEDYSYKNSELLANKYCAPAVTSKQAFDNLLDRASDLEAKLWGDSLNENSKAFVIIEEIFNDERMDLEKALPKVKLMGNDDQVIRLSTDTAPSRIHSYSMLQRLVEPEIENGERKTLSKAIDVMNFKKSMSESPDDYPHASTLGMGYVLNMHQAWVPDGFALGDLLYSLVLAPGEEQRLIVRENKQTYTITDEAEALDQDSENYAQSQDDDTTAAFNYAVNQLSQASSEYSYSAKSFSIGGSIAGAYNGIVMGLSGGYSKSSGKGSSSARQSNSHNETSSAAQSFQHSIKSASTKISQAKRLSMEMATSEVSDSVATKIIANHNHSHAMTIQYWEVMRRYKLETCIDSVDLVLFIPLKLIRFLPLNQSFYLDNTSDFNRTKFIARYDTLIRYYDTLYSRLSYKYRSGMNLIKRYSELPKWEMQKQNQANRILTFSFWVKLLTYDDLSVSLVLKNGKGTIAGACNDIDTKRMPITLNATEQYETSEDLRLGIRNYRNRTPQESDNLEFTFNLPDDITDDDISYIRINYSCNECSYSLKRDDSKLITIDYDHDDKNGNTTAGELFQRYIDNIYDYSKNNKDTENEYKLEAYYERLLPEAYLHPIVKISPNEMLKLGAPTIAHPLLKISSSNANKADDPESNTSFNVILSSTKLSSSMRVGVSSSCDFLHYSELLQMESTLHHIASNPMLYSQIIWASLSDDERVMMLEQYTINMNFDALDNSDTTVNDGDLNIPLLNCVNIKHMMGFYGNCMILPFTFPQRLAKKLGKTAADIQNSLYRYHTNNFRVPTTTISLPTKGMIGEAVLGETNVSEEIDITRFWNWQDSPIDKMEIDSRYLNGNDYLQGKSTKDVTALNMQGATAATPVTVPDIISALVNKQSPTFDNITGLDQLKEVLNTGTNSAAQGRDNAINSSTDIAKAALSALTSQANNKGKENNETNNQGSDESKPQGGDSDVDAPSDPSLNNPDSGEKNSKLDTQLLSKIVQEAKDYIQTNGGDYTEFFKSNVSEQYSEENIENLAKQFAKEHDTTLDDLLNNVLKKE